MIEKKTKSHDSQAKPNQHPRKNIKATGPRRVAPHRSQAYFASYRVECCFVPDRNPFRSGTV